MRHAAFQPPHGGARFTQRGAGQLLERSTPLIPFHVRVPFLDRRPSQAALAR
jgi:hypothetical protein